MQLLLQLHRSSAVFCMSELPSDFNRCLNKALLLRSKHCVSVAICTLICHQYAQLAIGKRGLTLMVNMLTMRCLNAVLLRHGNWLSDNLHGCAVGMMLNGLILYPVTKCLRS